MWDARAVRRVHAIVSGRVQGVSYRASAATEARRLRLTGWVRNRSDGTVELEAEGTAAQVAALLDWCRRGPALAEVTGVDARDIAVTGTDSAFQIR